MARIIVVGSGFAGLSAAARLAKLRHDVTVLERHTRPGGLLLGRRLASQHWVAGPPSVTVPGVFRDLFRKSGRPMDALIAISPAGPRRHVLPRRFGPTRTLDLPFGTRGAQHDAVEDAFGRDAWSPWVDELATAWDVLRRVVLESVGDEPLSPATGAATLDGVTLGRLARRLPASLRPVAIDPVGADAPAALGVWHYAERNFGRWRFDGGDAALAAALVTRLGERRVSIETSVEVTGVQEREGRATGVFTTTGARDADLVVWATGEAVPTSTFVGLRLREGSWAGRPDDVVVHGPVPVRVWRSGPDEVVVTGPRGHDAVAIAVAGLELGGHVLERHDAEPRTGPVVEASVIPRPAVECPPGVWLVGGAAVPGAGLEVTGMGTAALAQHVGAAPR